MFRGRGGYRGDLLGDTGGLDGGTLDSSGDTSLSDPGSSIVGDTGSSIVGSAMNWVGQNIGGLSAVGSGILSGVKNYLGSSSSSGAAAGQASVQGSDASFGGPGFKAQQYRVAHRHMDAWAVRRSRRMNPLNPHALRRSLRRAAGFSRFASKTMKFVHPGRRPHGFKFKRRRKRC